MPENVDLRKQRANHEHTSYTKPHSLTTLDVFSHDFSVLYTVPQHRVAHMPHCRITASTHLVMCRNFTHHQDDSSTIPCEGTQGCSMGDNCKFVHVSGDLGDLQSKRVHVNYIWHHQDDCFYEKLPPGKVLQVSAPNNRPPLEHIPSEKVLVTRGALERFALESSSPVESPSLARDGSHCAHFIFCRICTRGEDCGFVHALHVDPNAKSRLKRAPPAVVDRGTGRLTPPTTAHDSSCDNKVDPQVGQDHNAAAVTETTAHADHHHHHHHHHHYHHRCVVRVDVDGARRLNESPLSSRVPIPTTPIVLDLHEDHGLLISTHHIEIPKPTPASSPTSDPTSSPNGEVACFSSKMCFAHNPYRGETSTILYYRVD